MLYSAIAAPFDGFKLLVIMKYVPLTQKGGPFGIYDIKEINKMQSSLAT
jgi:hypothetical protein